MRRVLAIIAISTFTLAPLCAQQPTDPKAPAETRILDNSDWWSFYNFSTSFDGSRPQDRLVDLQSLAIDGITLTEQTSGQIESTFGKNVWLERGESSGVRSQACYVSTDAAAPTYLVFEDGIESNTAYYLFRGGRPWKGIDACLRSSAVRTALGTTSGIHLGGDMDSVVATLGKPSQRTASELRYVLHQNVKLSDKQMATFRSANPKMTDADLRKLASTTVEMSEYLTVRFDRNGLNYFAVFVALGESHRSF
jgi:hypothetical protein